MPGLVRGVARVAVAAGTATAVSNRVSRRQAERWSEQDSIPAAPEQAPAAPAADESRVAQLQKLAELKGQGVLTDDEFAAEKARILSA